MWLAVRASLRCAHNLAPGCSFHPLSGPKGQILGQNPDPTLSSAEVLQRSPVQWGLGGQVLSSLGLTPPPFAAPPKANNQIPRPCANPPPLAAPPKANNQIPRPCANPPPPSPRRQRQTIRYRGLVPTPPPSPRRQRQTIRYRGLVPNLPPPSSSRGRRGQGATNPLPLPLPANAPQDRKNREGPEETGPGERDEQGKVTGQGRPRSPKTVHSAEGGEGKDKREGIIVVVRSPCRETILQMHTPARTS